MDTAIVCAIIAAISASVVAPFVTFIISKSKTMSERDQALHNGMCLLLQDKARFLTNQAIKDGEITLAQRTFIHAMVDAAHALGANGEMTQCAEAVDQLTLKETK